MVHRPIAPEVLDRLGERVQLTFDRRGTLHTAVIEISAARSAPPESSLRR